MLPTDDSSNPFLEPEEILEAVAAVGSRDRFEVAYTMYAMSADAATVAELAAETTQPTETVETHVSDLVEAGVLTERMPCLVDPGADGAEYELTEFGRLLLEEGVLALFDAAETVGDVGVDSV